MLSQDEWEGIFSDGIELAEDGIVRRQNERAALWALVLCGNEVFAAILGINVASCAKPSARLEDAIADGPTRTTGDGLETQGALQLSAKGCVRIPYGDRLLTPPDWRWFATELAWPVGRKSNGRWPDVESRRASLVKTLLPRVFAARGHLARRIIAA